MILEICASTYQSALNAQNGGADRIELCEDLSHGGVTPSHDLIKKVKDHLLIPVFVLIRPRAGDFVYSDAEFNNMKAAIKFCKTIGCEGIVSGALKADNSMDVIRTAALIELSKPLPFTFHRAFDDVINPKEALLQLIDLRCSRVLTSGQKPTATEGLSLLKALNELSQNELTILAGGRIRSENANLFKEAGFTEIHSSAVRSGQHSDLEEIKKLVNIIND